MTIDKVISYVMYTPCNSNPSVLRSMLEALVNESGGTDTPGDDTEVVIYDGGDVNGYN